MSINDLLLIACKVSLRGGQEIMEVYQTDFLIDHKNDNSPLTLADQNSHDVIIQGLSETGFPVMSEEGVELEYAKRKSWLTYWCVDPLDGTREVDKRNGEFTVNIALIDGNTPVIGGIYIPVKDQLYAAADGTAYYLDNAIDTFNLDDFNLSDYVLRPDKKTSGSDTLKVLISRSHLSVETKKYVDDLKLKHKNLEFLSAGCALKFGWLADGKADLYPRFSPCMEWDTAAGHAILKTVGKNIYSYPSGEELRYNKINLVNDWFIAR